MIRLLAALSCFLLVAFNPVAAQTSPSVLADTFEVDNLPANAKPLVVNEAAQSHNFHVNNDFDYLKFDLAPGASLVITFTPASTQYGERWRADLTEEVMGTSFDRGYQTFGLAARTLIASSTFPVTTTFRLRISKNLAVNPGLAFSGVPSKYTVRADGASGNMPPYVSVTSPGNNSNHAMGSPVTLAATATDPDGTINRVEFLINGNKVGESMQAPYSYPWVPTAIGNYAFSARAVDNGGATTTSPTQNIVVSQGPQSPVVTLAPIGGPFVSGQSIPLSATATDGDGYITRVEFIANGTVLYTDYDAPYSYPWPNAPVGTHTLTARAFDETDRNSTSASQQVVVTGPNQPPTVSLTVTPAGSTFPLGQSFTLQATATDLDGTPQWVEFLVNGTVLLRDLTAPYATPWTPTTVGTYVLQARTIDNNQATANSSTTTITITAAGGTNQPPTASLTAPTAGAVYTLGQAITLQATASDPEGPLKRVEFLENGVVIQTVLGAGPYSYNWTPSTTGTRLLRARAVDNGSPELSTLSDEVSVTVNPTSTAVPDQAIVSLAGELGTHDPTVGALAGEGAVSGGAATYSIPIAIPPGRRGMQPELALSYGSGGGNGVAGIGWSLSGLSSIHRCPMTLEQDGQVAAVNFTATDRLCLDGQRLVVTNRGVYGNANTVYATEIDSFARITQLGGDLISAGTYFKVEYKSGEIGWFGGIDTTANAARVIPGGLSLPQSWLLHKREDRVGNNVFYNYQDYGYGEVLPATILYTGMAAASGDRKIELRYEARALDDQSSTYLAGGLVRQTQRLKTLATWVGSEAVREYRLGYGSSATSGRSLLGTVQECASNGSWTCRPSTNLEWQQTATNPQFRSLTFSGLPSGYELKRLTENGDIDGDGISELIATYATGDSAVPNASYFISVDADRSEHGVIALNQLTGVIAEWSSLNSNVDFNKDGRTDLIGATRLDANTMQLSVAFWNGTTTAWQPSAFTRRELGVFAPCFDDLHAADLNGDGYTDLIVTVPDNGICGNAGKKRLRIYLGTAVVTNGVPLPAVNTNATIDVLLPSAYIATGLEPSVLNFDASFKISRLDDFNGDGLPDIFLSRQTGRTERNKAVRLWLGRLTSGIYSLHSAGDTPDSFALLASPQMEPDETHVSAHANWLDINGDGLTDFISAKRLADGYGYWTVRLNSGGVLGPRIVTNSRRGIEWCTDTSSGFLSANCADRWNAPYESQFAAADTNTDGQAELLVPRGFAARICILHTYMLPVGKPGRDYYCAEDPLTGNIGPDPADFDPGLDSVKRIYASNEGGLYRGVFDPNAYFMDSLRFVQTGPTSVEVRVTNTPIIKGGFTAAIDLYGDSLQDQVSMLGYPFRPSTGNGSTLEGYAFIDSNNPAWGPVALPNGTPVTDLVAVRKPFLSENLGAGARPGQGPLLPDYLSTVSNALGHQTKWNYSVLSSRAGRGAGELPLYSVPNDAASRYIDARHIYFTSSMPVVADMKQSDGLGSFRSWKYGYSEAMYNLLGRGFQGFRKIMVDDESAGLRTTTAFYQRYPLTGQPEWVETSQRSTPTQLVSREDYIWRCDRSNRANTTACDVTPGSNPVRFPYLDRKDSRQFDLSTGQEIARSLEVNAGSDCNVTFEAASGFDAYGNLAYKTVQQFDSNGVADGYRPYVARQCVRTSNTYVSSTTAWWLDKLIKSVRTTSVTYAAGHALPSGASSPEQTLTTDYAWNTDRTLYSETVQNGVANQQRVSTYAYLNPINYGLPTSVTVVASGDSNGSRVTSTTYTADGYFPETVTNPLLQVASTTVRARDGQTSLVTDPNGLRTLTEYDAFGFPKRVRFRGASDSQFVAPDKQAALSWCNGGCGLARAVIKATVVQDGSPVQRTYQDALGRTLRSTSTLFDGTLSQSDTEYNARGLINAQSEPYRAGESAAWTYFTAYDALGRLTAKSVPQQHSDGRGDRVTTYAYSGRRTDIQVCGSVGTGTCVSMSRTTDSLGRNVETIDALAGTTRYWFDANGNAAAIQDVKGSVVVSSYNALGQRISNSDPNQGASSFSYNALGEVLTQTDARSVVTTATYDKLSRPKTSSASIDVTGDNVADSVLDTWDYDPANGKGLPGQSQRTVNGVLERRDTPSYDALARPFETATVQNTGSGLRSWTAAVQYDGYYGRPKAQTTPNAETVWLRYSSYGHLSQESDANGSQTYRQLTATDARGQPIGETYGNSLTATRTYWPASGQVKRIAYGNGRQLDYQYDVYGNLRRQELNGGTSVETLEYDPLHRLKLTQRSGGAGSTAVNYDYDAAGNFLYKSDYSVSTTTAYGYSGGLGGGGPNAVKTVQLKAGGTRSYGYDASGNMTSDNTGFIGQYDHRNLPTKLQRSGAINQFAYGPDNAKARQWGTDGVRLYGPGYEELPATGETKAYIGNYLVISKIGASRNLRFLLTDRLGSVDAVTDVNGTLIETRGYDAFGAPRSGAWADATPPRLTSTAVTPKGFTQHEHLNSLELIHMNGRSYDYKLGRFMGVDPFIQSPTNSQSLNPYSYIMNNPLSGTDPTGYRVCSVNDNLSCLDDGVNTVTGGKGGNATVYVGQKGDNVAFTGEMNVKQFKYISSSINVALNPTNGAENWVKNGPAGSRNSSSIGSAGGRGKGCAGDGPLQCYSVTSRRTGGKDNVGSFERTFESSDAYGAVNGILNYVGRAMELMAGHIHDRFGASSFLLVHNPTEGFLRDSLETARDKVGLTTAAASQFADILGGVDHPMSWVAHSQGGAIFAEAMRYNLNRGLTGMSNIRVAFDSGANNRWVTNRYAARSGVGVIDYYDAPNDAVPQVLGLRAWNRPDRFLWSVLSVPLLFSDHSPHTNAVNPQH